MHHHLIVSSPHPRQPGCPTSTAIKMNPSADFCGRPRCTGMMMLVWYQEARPTKTCCGTIAAEMIRHEPANILRGTLGVSQDTYRPSRYQAHCRKQNSFSLLSLTNERPKRLIPMLTASSCAASAADKQRSLTSLTTMMTKGSIPQQQQRHTGPVCHFSFLFYPFSFPFRRSSESVTHCSTPFTRADLTYRPHLPRTYPYPGAVPTYLQHELGVAFFISCSKKRGGFLALGVGGCVCFFLRAGRYEMEGGGSWAVYIRSILEREAIPLAMRLLVNSCSSVWRCFSSFGVFSCPVMCRSVWAPSPSSLSLLSIIILGMYLRRQFPNTD